MPLMKQRWAKKKSKITGIIMAGAAICKSQQVVVRDAEGCIPAKKR
jgi:hypothetical protein